MQVVKNPSNRNRNTLREQFEIITKKNKRVLNRAIMAEKCNPSKITVFLLGHGL